MTVTVSKPALNIREELSSLKKVSGVKGEELLRANTTADVYNAIGNNRNLVINGDMRIAQRGTSATGISSSSRFVVDRMPLYIQSAGTWTYTQSTNAPQGFNYSARFECTTAATSLVGAEYVLPQYVFEGHELLRFGWGTAAAKPVTISFWARSNVTGPYTIEMQTQNSKEISARYYINQANVWEYKTITFPPNTSVSITPTVGFGGCIYFWLASGTVYNGGLSVALHNSWGDGTNDRCAGNVNLASAVGNYFELTGLQVEVGATATPFEYRSYGDELIRCQRYYQKFRSMYETSLGGTGTIAGPVTSFTTPMRSNPTMTTFTENVGSAGATLNQMQANGSDVTGYYSYYMNLAISTSSYAYRYVAGEAVSEVG